MAKIYDVDFAVFIVPDDTFNDGKTYTGSIRAKDNTIDCTVIASYMNGGGHATGAGFTVTADTLEEAQSLVKTTITDHETEARKAISP